MGETKTKFTGKSLLVLLGLALATGALFIPASSGLSQNELSSEVKKIAESCRALENREQCYAKAFENLTKESDRDHAFVILRALQQTDPEARGCHFIAHAISTAETQKNPAKWRELMNTAPPDCSYGAAHGALEVYASTFPDGKLPKNEIPNLCDNPDNNNCTHGLGHLLLVMNENDIPESLKDCESLPHDYMGIFECLTGVFMERITAVNLEIHGLAGKEALNWPARLPELEALCRSQNNTHSIPCWKEIVHVALAKFQNDPQKLVDFCETAPGDEETRQCIDHALGIIAGSLNFDLANMGSVCETRTKASDFKERCYAHLVSATLSTVPQEIHDAVRFCNGLDSVYLSSCFTMIGNSLHRAKPELKEILANECASAPADLRERCENGGATAIRFHAGN